MVVERYDALPPILGQGHGALTNAALDQSVYRVISIARKRLKPVPLDTTDIVVAESPYAGSVASAIQAFEAEMVTKVRERARDRSKAVDRLGLRKPRGSDTAEPSGETRKFWVKLVGLVRRESWFNKIVR